jgi:uncharacterized protein
MLLEFSVGNFRSIKDLQTISLVATHTVSKDKEVDTNNVFQATSKVRLLKTVAIYGANASGKSNFIKAMNFFRYFVIRSIKDADALKEMIQPFALSTEMADKPTYFQVFFKLNEQVYRYGFEATQETIVSEWLFGTPHEREVCYFKRSFQKAEINKKQFPEAYKLQSLLEGKNPVFRKDALLITTLTAFNTELARQIVQFFMNMTIISGLTDSITRNIADNFLFSIEVARQKAVQLLQSADIGLTDIQILEERNEKEPPFLTVEAILEGKHRKKVLTVHPKFDEKKQLLTEKVFLDLDSQGSEGTKKLYEIAFFLFTVLEAGGILIIDEFDARLHPKLSKQIIELFNNANTNPKNAQLVVVTHDTHLLSAQLFRRDQIIFVEKDKYGASQCYSLAQFKGVRNDASFENDYLMGRYGAVPSLNHLTTLFETQK